MALESAFVGEGQHLVVHTGGIADAEHVDTMINQFLADPIHCHIALGTHQHLRLAVEGLVDGFHEGGGLACAWRPVDNGHILGQQHLIHGLLLCGVEPGEGQGLEHIFLRLAHACEDVAKFGQTVVLGIDGIVQGMEHGAVARFVEIELDTQSLTVLHVNQGLAAWEHHHHPTGVFHAAHRAAVAEVVALAILAHAEKADRLAVFKEASVVVLVVGAVLYLHHQLVEGVVVAASTVDGIPAQATANAGGKAHTFGLLLVFGFLGFVFLLQQRAVSDEG